MANYPIEAGIQISIDGTSWFKLTDHNRAEISANPEIVEKSARMANGTMRKYVIAKKMVISTSWDYVPSKTDCTVDNGFSSEWLDAFYDANIFLPIKVKIVSAQELTPEIGFYPNESTRLSSLTASKTYDVFVTNYSSTVVKRGKDTDFVNMQIEFTEI
jgi:hypothetical protein